MPVHLVKDEVREVVVAELIDQELHVWRSEFIMNIFEKEDAEAICKIQLSQRYVEDLIIWLHHKKGLFTVKSAYKVTKEVMRGGNVAESSRGCVGKRIWTTLWKLRIPNKIKVFGWRACNDILPTKLNLTKRRIIDDAVCPICMRFLESAIHVLWECDAAQDVWAGSLKILQKGVSGMIDVLHLMEYLLDRVESEELEVVLVQAWLIWNQRNRFIHGGKFHDPGWLNNRARDYLEEYRIAIDQMGAEPEMQTNRDTWQPPPHSVFKLNFDVALFLGLNKSGFGVIQNEKEEVMATMVAKGLEVFCSEEAKLLACRKAIKFQVDASFSELVIEGDNSSVMKAILASKDDQSMLGNVIGDIQHLIRNLHWVRIECTRRGGNRVAHVLVQFARNIIDDMYWMEDLPPIAREALYQDANFSD